MKFHGHVAETIQGVDLYYADFGEGVTYSSSAVLEPAFEAYNEASKAMGLLGCILKVAVEPSPDFKTALEMLSREEALMQMHKEDQQSQ